MAGAFGVLALQGDFAAHAAVLRRLGVDAPEVRRVAELAGLDGLVIPGGESTTLLHLMRDEPWFEALRAFHARGGALLGTCAGAILLAREVRPGQASLGLLDACVERNGFGRQRESFEIPLVARAELGSLSGIFIRAPRFVSLGAGVELLAELALPGAEAEPVLVRQGRVIAATFHPELRGATALHELLLDAAAAHARAGAQASAGAPA
ncbi:MAG: pyridoxal 5'-phosphate synthase glutaminase subunit PdxT [Vicinamibacteria bacterium]